MISIQVHEGRSALTTLEPAWTQLLDQLSYARVFASPAWFQAWLDVYSPSKIAILTAWRDGQMVGLLPVIRMRTDARGFFFSRVSPPAPGITDYQSPVVLPDAAADALPALWDAQLHLFGRRVQWWPNLPEDDPALDILKKYLERRGMPYYEEFEKAPYLSFAADSYTALEQNWTASHRKDFRRQRKRLEEIGPVSLWQPASAEEAAPILEDFFTVHDQKWLDQGFPGIFSDPKTRAFFHAIRRHLFGKGLHFSTLRCGDIDVSYNFGFFSGGWMQWYRPSYRREFQVYSPSKIHIGMLMEQGYTAGWKGFDFLLGEEGYKLQWAPSRRRVVSIHAASSRFSPAYFWFSKGKPWLRARASIAMMRWKAKWLRWRNPVVSNTPPSEPAT